MSSYRIECFKDGEFKKLYIVNSRDEADMKRCNWETSGKTYTTRMFKCNKNGNNYSGREIHDMGRASDGQSGSDRNY